MFSVEFAEHRLYNTGESTKNIDWKLYGRTDKLFVKRYVEETNLRCHLLLDISSSMFYPKESLSKIKFACLASAVIANLLKKQRDAFGLSVFDNDVRIHTQCRSATSHYRLLLSYLDGLIKDTQIQKTTSTAKALHQLADSIHRRSLVITFSDMFDSGDDTDELFAALQHLKYAKHEVLLFHVTDRKHELAFEYENRPYLFVDMESGEEIKLQHNQVKDLYVKKVMDVAEQAHRSSHRRACAFPVAPCLAEADRRTRGHRRIP